MSVLEGFRYWPPAPGFELEPAGAGRRYRHRPPSLWALVEESAARVPEKQALGDPVRTVTFASLRDEVAMAAAYLAGLGVRRGERVALLLSGGVHFAVAFLAVVRLGAIAVPLNVKLTPVELGHIVGHSGATWILGEGAVAANLGDADLGSLGTLRHLQVDPLDLPWLRPGAAAAPLGAPPGEDDLALLIYTSGTTGRPKGVRLSHANLIQSVMSYAHTLGLTADDSTLIVVPLFYVTGLVAQLLLFLYLGGTTIIQPRFEPDAAVRLLHAHRITFFHAVATVFIKLTEAGSRSGIKLEHLRLACCGGGPVTPAVIAALKRWLPGLDFRPVYGLTETSSPATISPHDGLSRPEKPRSAGRPIPVVDCLVADDDGKQLPPGETGELLVRGAVVVDGYWEDEETSKMAFGGGWFRTGDLAKYDEDGYVYIVDRKKDLINRGGEKVSGSEVEAVLAEFPGVREVAVVAAPHPVYGETPAAFVVVDEPRLFEPEALLAFARSRLARFKVPTQVDIVDELPRSAYGKVLKGVLRERLSVSEGVAR